MLLAKINIPSAVLYIQHDHNCRSALSKQSFRSQSLSHSLWHSACGVRVSYEVRSRLFTKTALHTYYTMCDNFTGLAMKMFRVSYDGKQQAQYEESAAETRVSHRCCCAGYSHRLLARLERHSARYQQQQCIRCPSKSREDPCSH